MTGRHLFIPLDPQNLEYYASCNILNDEGLVYVYLLHPKKGSLLFTLNFSEADSMYKARYIVPGLDNATLELINKKLLDGNDGDDLTSYSANYQRYACEEAYEYFVVNRMYHSNQNIILPSNIFHIFHESWESSNEYQWDLNKGQLIPQTGGLEAPDMKIIKDIIIGMGERP